jgi:hypothetical protein
MTVPAKKCGDWDVETLAAFLASTPHSSSPIVSIGFSQFIFAFWTDELVIFVEVFLDIHVSTLYVLDQGTFSYVERFAVRATVMDGNTCGIAFWAEDGFVKECSLEYSTFVKFPEK